MCYILKASNSAFVIIQDEIVITSNYLNATKFSTIGEAMKVASEVNNKLNSNLIKVISL